MAADGVRDSHGPLPIRRAAAFRCQMPSHHERESATTVASRTAFQPVSDGLRTSLNASRRGRRPGRRTARRVGLARVYLGSRGLVERRVRRRFTRLNGYRVGWTIDVGPSSEIVWSKAESAFAFRKVA
jgi:hypothetical protein